MKKIIFDIETQTPLYDPETPEITDMKISVLSLYSSDTGKYHSFTEKNFSEMEKFFKEADMLVTFNGVHFDIPVLQKYLPNINLSDIYHIDIMVEIQNSIGKRIGLDSIAANTLGTSKSANGLQAVAWWNSGEITKIIKYCEQDVKVTKDVYEYALKNGELFYEDKKTKEKKKILLNTKNWEQKKEEDNSLTLF